MGLTLVTIATGLVLALIVTVLGGFGLTTAIFKGLTNIPMFMWIAIIIVIILTLLKGGKK